MSSEDEKDRLGDTLKKKQRGEEGKYFAEQDRLRLAKLRAQTEAAERAARGSCPRCGHPLVGRRVRGTTVDECTGGCGVWLDRGALEQLGGATDDRTSFLTTLLADLGLIGKA
jgi:hypothetical protein